MDLRRQKWMRIVTECNTSGMKKKDWLELHGIAAKSFYHWQKLLRGQALEEEYGYPIVPDYIQLSPETLARAETTVSENKHDLVDLTALVSTKREEAVSHPATISQDSRLSAEIMLQIGSYSLYIGENITEATLATVLKVIGHA